MASNKVEQLKEDLTRAQDNDRPKDAVKLLRKLEEAEPRDPRWPHRLGDALKQLDKKKDAVDAWSRAADRYSEQGFIARAVAMAKTILYVDPTRVDILRRVEEGRSRSGQFRAVSPAAQAPRPVAPQPTPPSNVPVVGPNPMGPASSPGGQRLPRAELNALLQRLRKPDTNKGTPAAAPTPAGPSPDVRQVLREAALKRPAIAPPVAQPAAPPPMPKPAAPPPMPKPAAPPPMPKPAAPPPPMPKPAAPPPTVSAKPPPPPRRPKPPPPVLSNVPEPEIAELSLDDVIELKPAEHTEADEIRFDDDGPIIDIDFSELELSDRPAISERSEVQLELEELAMLPASPFFAKVGDDVLKQLTLGSELIERDDHDGVVLLEGSDAVSLFVIVDGGVRLVHIDGDEIESRLGEGDVFGVSCLLDNAQRTCDVRVDGHLTALEIPRELLLELTDSHPDVGSMLFELLTRRLVGNLLSSNELFLPFDAATRRELARSFEARRATANTILLEQGKRSDALYILLAGHLEVVTEDGRAKRVKPGAIFGQRSLISGATSELTARAISDIMVFRMPTRQFNLLAMQYPPALEYLSNLATKPIHSIAPKSLA